MRTAIAISVSFAVLGLTYACEFILIAACLGEDGTFAGTSYRPSSAWITLNLFAGFFAGLAGGAVCTLISRGRWRTIGVLCLVVGVLSVGESVAKEVIVSAENMTEQRLPTVSIWTSLDKLVEPRFMHFANPAVTIAGIIVASAIQRY